MTPRRRGDAVVEEATGHVGSRVIARGWLKGRQTMFPTAHLWPAPAAAASAAPEAASAGPPDAGQPGHSPIAAADRTRVADWPWRWRQLGLSR